MSGVPVSLNNGNGDNLGTWCLAKVTETQAALFSNGIAREQTLDLEFSRYGDDIPQQ